MSECSTVLNIYSPISYRATLNDIRNFRLHLEIQLKTKRIHFLHLGSLLSPTMPHCRMLVIKGQIDWLRRRAVTNEASTDELTNQKKKKTCDSNAFSESHIIGLCIMCSAHFHSFCKYYCCGEHTSVRSATAAAVVVAIVVARFNPFTALIFIFLFDVHTTSTKAHTHTYQRL